MPPNRSERVRAASRQRREDQRREVRQAILDAAGALFIEHGYAGFSLRQVAEQIGYSATTIYLHFADKDDLLFTLADEGFRRFGARLAAAEVGTADPIGRILALGRAYLDFGLEETIYYQLMFMQRGDFLLGCREGEEQPRLAALGLLQRAFAGAIDAGHLKHGPAATYADTFWALAHGIVALHIALPIMGHERCEATASVAFRALLDGLTAMEK